MRTWQLQHARRHMKDLLDAATTDGPQRVTRHGAKAVVVVAEEEWQRATTRVPSFGRLLAQCPLEEGDLPPRRSARVVREDEIG